MNQNITIQLKTVNKLNTSSKRARSLVRHLRRLGRYCFSSVFGLSISSKNCVHSWEENIWKTLPQQIKRELLSPWLATSAWSCLSLPTCSSQCSPGFQMFYRSWEDFSTICHNTENQTHLNIFAKKKTIGRTRNAKIIQMVLPLILIECYIRPTYNNPQQQHIYYVKRWSQTTAFVVRTWRCSGDWVWPSGFSKSRSMALPKSISCKLGSGLRNYGSTCVFNNLGIMCQDPKISLHCWWCIARMANVIYKPWRWRGVAEKEVVRFDVRMDNSHCMDQLNQSKQFCGQVDCHRLNDAPGRDHHEMLLHMRICTYLSEFLVKLTRSSRVPMRWIWVTKIFPSLKKSDIVKHKFLSVYDLKRKNQGLWLWTCKWSI